MRVVAAAAVASLALIVAGCGAGSSRSTHAAGALGDAPTLVPSDAKAFVAVDTDFASRQWQRIDALTKSFPARATLMAKVLHGLDLQKDVAPALGPEVDVAALGEHEIVAFTKPTDESKLKSLVAKLSTANEQYTVQQIAGWSVVADSQDVFTRIRAVETGHSLADNPAFRKAWASVPGDSVARAYATGRRVDWLAARVSAESDALRVDAAAHPVRPLPSLAARSLLRDVPSGAALAIAFRGTGDLLEQLPAMKLPVKQLAPLLAGGGVLYARPSGLIPEIALELAPKDPQEALATARRLVQKLAGKLGPVTLTAQVSAGKLVIADFPGAVSALRSGPKLVDDAAYKDATGKAGVPAQTTFLAYADVPQLAPFIPMVIQAVTGKAPDPALGDNLAHVGPVVAWGTREGGLVHVHLWVQPH